LQKVKIEFFWLWQQVREKLLQLFRLFGDYGNQELKRGYYSASFSPISLQPKDTEKGEITEKYARMLEKDILENPAYWLWTHKRWK
jgi:hypothetical protein